MAGITESIEKLGGSIRGAWNSYGEAVKRISGHGGLLSKVETLKGMGVSPKKTLKAIENSDSIEGKGSDFETIDKAVDKLKAIK